MLAPGAVHSLLVVGLGLSGVYAPFVERLPLRCGEVGHHQANTAGKSDALCGDTSPPAPGGVSFGDDVEEIVGHQQDMCTRTLSSPIRLPNIRLEIPTFLSASGA